MWNHTLFFMLAMGMASGAYPQNSCAELKDLKLEHASVVSAKWFEAGPATMPEGYPFQSPNTKAVRHCEVSGVSRPTSDSEIRFLLWLPAADDWNGKYLQRGNGGWAGFLPVSELIAPVNQGYAVAGTDDGHAAKDGSPNASWVVGHPEKLIDFGYRAVHETAVQSKAIASAYYNKPLARAYFEGCSDGGREAMMEAERFPEDFEGIIAGAPANHWTHHFAGFLWNERALESSPGSKLGIEQLRIVEKAALAACDALDGLKDGLISDPRKCHFDPASIVCPAGAAAGGSCLTQPQIDALNKIYAGPKDPVTGEQIYPGYETGTEAEAGSWVPWIVPGTGMPASLQAMFGHSMYAQAVHENSQFDTKTSDLGHDLRLAEEKTSAILDSYNPDLRSFRAHGGKLIEYHGWGDAAIAPRDSIAFYEMVERFLDSYPDPRAHGVTDIQAFYRLFMVPGMGHCGGGPGPTNFGDGDPSIPPDAEHNVLKALDRWVTAGTAPEAIIGSGQVNGIKMTRPLCPYPKVAKYKGQGDTNLAQSFTCGTN